MRKYLQIQVRGWMVVCRRDIVLKGYRGWFSEQRGVWGWALRSRHGNVRARGWFSPPSPRGGVKIPWCNARQVPASGGIAVCMRIVLLEGKAMRKKTNHFCFEMDSLLNKSGTSRPYQRGGGPSGRGEARRIGRHVGILPCLDWSNQCGILKPMGSRAPCPKPLVLCDRRRKSPPDGQDPHFLSSPKP